jgi:hypothetical protein
MDTNKRKTERKNSLFYLNVTDRLTGKSIGRLVNLSPEGLMLVSDKPIDKNQTFNLMLELPKKIHNSGSAFFSATSRYSHRDVNPQYFNTGFCMEEITPRDLFALKSLLKEYSFSS